MPQFAVYKNGNPGTRRRIPYLVDVQHDLLGDLATSVVIPLYLEKATSLKPITRLTPRLQIEGKTCILMTPQLAGIARHELSEAVASVSKNRAEILAAIDLLLTGF